MNKPALIFCLSFAWLPLRAQDTLPSFSARNLGNKRILLEWINKFEDVRQISIQRSPDSLRNFKTILTVADPSAPQNGFMDTRFDSDRQFYRLFIVLDKGVFMFSPSKRATWDTADLTKRMTGRPEKPSLQLPAIPADSIHTGPAISINRPRAEAWSPSKYVYTYRDGYIRISLPDEPDKKYSIKFFTADDQLLFELKDIQERTFRLDKTNFYHSGWFKFELYEGGKVIEKNKFFLPKEF